MSIGIHLGIDTSNYTTSAAAVSSAGEVFCAKRLLSVPQGQRGLRQQDALFCHTRLLSAVLEEALAKVKEKNSQFIFNIVGRGSDVKKFQNLTKELGLEEQVNFVGVVKDKKVLNSYYSNADLFLFPSVFDNDALVLLEAGFQGTPSLVLRNTGSAERIVENESGFATENDLDAYANKILELMQDKSLLEKVGERAKSIYTPWEDTVIKYLDFYKQTIKNYK
jgi:glycosyltransferase involved in cell wall biosynthesis